MGQDRARRLERQQLSRCVVADDGTIYGLEDDYASAKGMGYETWREPGFERFDRLDDEIGRQLLAILGPELVTSLPPHGSLGTLPEEKKWDGKGKGEGESKGGGGAGADGKGRGSKRTGNVSGGK